MFAKSMFLKLEGSALTLEGLIAENLGASLEEFKPVAQGGMGAIWAVGGSPNVYKLVPTVPVKNSGFSRSKLPAHFIESSELYCDVSGNNVAVDYADGQVSLEIMTDPDFEYASSLAFGVAELDALHALGTSKRVAVPALKRFGVGVGPFNKGDGNGSVNSLVFIFEQARAPGHSFVKNKDYNHLDTVRFVKGLGEAIISSSKLGFSHGDISFGNAHYVFDESSKNYGEVTVLDFGFSRRINGYSGSLPLLDPTLYGLVDHIHGFFPRRGHIVGTLSYISPERAKTSLHCSKDDHFALGVMAYSILTDMAFPTFKKNISDQQKLEYIQSFNIPKLDSIMRIAKPLSPEIGQGIRLALHPRIEQREVDTLVQACDQYIDGALASYFR